MSGFRNSIIGGAAALIRAAIKSPNYVMGSLGWSINKDGSAEFNNLTIRGTFDGNDFIVNQSGAFFYSPSPGAGNLVASIAPAGGTDSYGNIYDQGISSYGTGGQSGIIGQFLSGGIGFSWLANAEGLGGPPSTTDAALSIAVPSGNSVSPGLLIHGPSAQSTGSGIVPVILLQGYSFDSSSPPSIIIQNSDGSAVPVNITGALAVNGNVSGTQVPITAVTNAKTTISTTGYTNAGIGIALGVGTYVIEARIFWKPSGTIGGTHTHGFNYSGTASSAGLNGVANQANGTGGINQGTGETTTAPSAGNVDVVASPVHLAFFGWTEIYGYIVTTSSGTLNPVVKIGTSGDTVDLYSGSMFRVTRIA